MKAFSFGAPEMVVIALGLIGVVISWFYFVPTTLENGYFASWAAAFSSHPFSLGLHWDLVFSDAAIMAIAIIERKRIGTPYMVGTIVMGLTLGVCAAIPTYWIGSRRASQG